MYTESAAHKLLFEPAIAGADQLCILTAHATPGMASWLLKSYDERGIAGISIQLIIGTVVEEGISTLFHEGFKELHGKYYSNRSGKFVCSYIYKNFPMRENIYLWLKSGKPILAFSGDFEFTQSSILQEQNKDIIEQNPEEADRIFESAVNCSVYCNYSEIEEDIRIYRSDIVINCRTASDADTADKVDLSLLTRRGDETGKRSGLNWGQRGGRNKNETYIPLPSKIAKSGFFPLNRQHFIVLTDDHCALLLRVEQQNDKAITTPASNAQLGEYFRKRLGLPNGAYVRKEDLLKYGRTNVSFYKIDDEQFYMDFSAEGNG